jgi:hypothetical protein
MTHWKQPTTLSLAEKLKELNARLREVLPLLVQAQGEAIKRMAETAVAAQPKPPKGEDHA